jgi:hypothetical protein
MNGRHTFEGDVCDLRVFEDATDVMIGNWEDAASARGCDQSLFLRCFEGDRLVFLGLLVLFDAVKKPSRLDDCGGGTARNGSELLRILMFRS